MFERHRHELASRHYQVFLVALAVMLEHLLEDALVHKENGSSLAAQLGSSGLTLLLVAIGAALYPLLRRTRAVLVALYGLLALSAGWRAHVWDALDGDAAGGDYTGVLYALAGIALLALAVKLAADSLRDRSVRARREARD
jgi:hypothetical protein